MNTDVEIRSAHAGDAEQVAALIRQLGYAMEPDTLRVKLTQLATSGADQVFVAESEGRLLGCLGLHAVPLLHAEGTLGRLTTLVVDEAHRGRGIGHALVMAAHAWFKAAGCTRFEVTSGDHRERAHRFYERLGYLRQGQRLTMVAA
ncbi:MAG: hypothetical protein RSP_22860 [Rhodanobacter sp.]